MPNPSFDINHSFTVRKNGKPYTMPIKLVVHTSTNFTMHIDQYEYNGKTYCVFAEICKNDAGYWQLSASKVTEGAWIGAYNPSKIVSDYVCSMFKRVLCELASAWIDGNQDTLKAMDSINAESAAKSARSNYESKIDSVRKAESWVKSASRENGTSKTVTVFASGKVQIAIHGKRVSIFWLKGLTVASRNRFEKLLNGRPSRVLLDDNIRVVYRF